MTTYISLLRGINVGGKMIKMDALKNMYEGLSFENVQTYIQSGNVVFKYKESDQKELEQKIVFQIKKEFGLDVSVLVLNIHELKNIIDSNPFAKDPSKQVAYLHVTFLASPPKTDNFEGIEKVKFEGEEIIIKDKAVYLYCPHGYGRTKLSNNFLENKLKVNATTRNWKTSLELLKIGEKHI